MDEKQPTMTSRLLSTPFSRRSRLFSTRRLLLAITLTCTIFYFYPALIASLSPSTSQRQSLKQQPAPVSYPLSHPSPEQASPVRAGQAPESISTTAGPTTRLGGKKPVSLEAHVMSKCPDARDCLRDLVVPAMSEIDALVDFKLFYIGTVEADNTVVCKHGPGECLGNSISLCAQELYANNTKASLGFTNCLLKDYKSLPDKGLVQDCAMEHRVDFEKINRCVSDDGRGEELLRKSVIGSKERGVKYSCTVRLEDETWCVRDDGEWKECGAHGASVAALVEEIQKRTAAGETDPRAQVGA